MTGQSSADVIEPPRIVPPHYFMLAFVSMGILAVATPQEVLIGLPGRIVGAVLFVAALVVATRARNQFADAGTEIRPLHASSALVTDGMFRFSRNPMYAAMFVGLAGVALMSARALPWLVVPVFIGLIYLRFVRPEEALMERQFGQDYLDYKARVRRWL